MFNLDSFRSVQRQNDFSVVVKDSDWTPRWISLISNQTVAIDMNLVQRTVTLYVQQLKSGAIMDLIFHILKAETRKIDEITITGAKSAKQTVRFTNGVLVDHETELNYYKSDEAVIHQLVIEFDTMELLSAPSKDGSTVITISDEQPVDQGPTA